MNLLGFDTATPATVVGLLRDDAELFEERHDPGEGERPGHATQLLVLVDTVLEQAGLSAEEVGRVAVGLGPGSFTGLRIGIATARGLAQGLDCELAGVSTLRALAEGAAAEEADPTGAVVAVIDARRGEVFAAAWLGGEEVLAPAALTPPELAARLGEVGANPLAVGDGAVRFRATLSTVGAVVPPDGDPLHRVGARQVCRLGAEARAAERDAVRPTYLRLPDARPRPPKTP